MKYNIMLLIVAVMACVEIPACTLASVLDWLYNAATWRSGAVSVWFYGAVVLAPAACLLLYRLCGLCGRTPQAVRRGSGARWY